MTDENNELVTIEALPREKSGKGNARKLRQKGNIPAILLEKGKSTLLELNPKMLSKAWKKDKIFNLSINGAVKVVKIQELQYDHVKRTALHVDLVYVK